MTQLTRTRQGQDMDKTMTRQGQDKNRTRQDKDRTRTEQGDKDKTMTKGAKRSQKGGGRGEVYQMHVHLIHLPPPGASGTKPGTKKTTVLDKSQNKSQNKSARRPSRIRAATKIDKYTFICVLSIKRVLFRVLSHVMFHVLFRLLSQTVNIFVPGFVPEGRYFCSSLLFQGPDIFVPYCCSRGPIFLFQICVPGARYFCSRFLFQGPDIFVPDVCPRCSDQTHGASGTEWSGSVHGVLDAMARIMGYVLLFAHDVHLPAPCAFCGGRALAHKHPPTPQDYPTAHPPHQTLRYASLH